MLIWLALFLLASALVPPLESSSPWNDPTSNQFHIQTDEGPERYFRYQTLSGQYRKEKRLEDGTVIGSYAWIDGNGYLRQRDYIADGAGYRILKSKNIFVGSDTNVGDAVKSTKNTATGYNNYNRPVTQPPYRTPYINNVVQVTPKPVYSVPRYQTPSIVDVLPNSYPSSTPAPFLPPSSILPPVVSSTISPLEPTSYPSKAYIPSSSSDSNDVVPNHGVTTPSSVYIPSSTRYIPPPSEAYLPSSTPSSAYIPSSTPSRVYIPSSTPSSVYLPSSTPSSVYLPSSTPSRVYIPSSTPSSVYVPSSTPSSLYLPSSTPGYRQSYQSNSLDYGDDSQFDYNDKFVNPYIHQNGPTYPIDSRGNSFNPHYNNIGNGYDAQYPYYDGISVTNDGFRYYIPRAYHEEQSNGYDRKTGSFGYIDPFGIRRVVYYNAGPDGFKHKKNNRYVGFDATPYDPRPYS